MRNIFGIEPEPVRLAAQMLMDLGPNVYSEDFEQHFLAKAAEFYQVSRRFIRSTKPPPGSGVKENQNPHPSAWGACWYPLQRYISST